MVNVDPKFILYQIKQAKRARNWSTVDQATYDAYTSDPRWLRRRLAIMPEYFIVARGYWDKHGWHYIAELREAQSGNTLIDVSLYGCRDQWMQAIADKMTETMPEVFPAMARHLIPSIYFREVCNVPYDFREVQRKKDL